MYVETVSNVEIGGGGGGSILARRGAGPLPSRAAAAGRRRGAAAAGAAAFNKIYQIIHLAFKVRNNLACNISIYETRRQLLGGQSSVRLSDK